jgi:broad specificity phosphatase PhoE
MKGPRVKHRLIPTAVLLLLLALPSVALAQKLVIIVRHAERADAGMASKETDPLLSAAGAARANKLSVMLADAGIKAIYVTQYKRTQDTAKPLADKLNIKPEPTPLSGEALAARLKSQHGNDVVLLVGHSDTVPAIIKALGGPVVTIGESEFDNMFFIVPATGLVTRIHY